MPATYFDGVKGIPVSNRDGALKLSWDESFC
ncbi:MAG: hypothetical protein GDYSWBUE_001392 [Candidatus Fervidibacterota bacterium]